MKITSRDNQRLKFARKVRDEKIADRIFIEGIRLAEEALRSDLEIDEAFISEDIIINERFDALLKTIDNKRLERFELSAKNFNSIADTKNPQGIILIAKTPQTGIQRIETNLLQTNKKYSLLILLHKINNPTNLGAILRTCDAVGVSGVIISKNSTKPFTAKAVRASMGASFKLPIWTDADFTNVLEWSKNKGFSSICADVNAENNLYQTDFKRPCLIVFGSEAHGLDQNERNLVEESINIPLENDVESLNLAVACGVILFEAKRQIDDNFQQI